MMRIARVLGVVSDRWIGLFITGALIGMASGCDDRPRSGGYVVYDDRVGEHADRMALDSGCRPKSILNLGDSISNSDCFLWPERSRVSQPGLLSRDGYVFYPKSWSTQYEATSAWGRAQITEILAQARPEVVTILLGTNDLASGQVTVDEYQDNMRAVVESCLAHNSLPILFSIPPAQGIDLSKLHDFNAILRYLAFTFHVPLIETDRLFMDNGSWPMLCRDGRHPESLPDGSGGYDLINRMFRTVYKRLEYDVFQREPGVAEQTVLSQKTRPDSLVETRIDTNNDKIPDIWRFEAAATGNTREEYDSDYDGKVDVIWLFHQGHLRRGREDLGRDGKFIPFEIKEGWKNETP